MSLLETFTRYPDQEACIEHLEAIRWGDSPTCPHCDSLSVARKADGERIGRWNCHDCHASFNVLSGTIFSKTKVPLQKWFLAAALIINAKESLSSHQLARDLDLNQKTVWYMQHRIRTQMATEQGSILLQGIVKAGETIVGGKPRKPNKRESVIGAVERGGKVVAQFASDLTGRSILRLIRETVPPGGSLLISDEERLRIRSQTFCARR